MPATPNATPNNVQMLGPTEGHDLILSDAALAFVEALTVQFRPRVEALLQARREAQARYDRGEFPRFLPETADIRAGDWKVGPIPKDLRDRRVEITGPIDAKMIINALNSGANVFMADCEDSCSPTWVNQVQGQHHLYAAVRHTLTFVDEARGKQYALQPAESLATLMVRPRGLHLLEKHMHVDGAPVPASLFDFGLYFFHNAAELVARGTGPYFYIPKLQSHHEARLWNDIFCAAQDALGIPRGTIRATVLIETLPAAFEMDEILHALREHSAGLNCGRWDYIFSFIKTVGAHADAVLPDRSQVGMTQPCMAAYTGLVIKTCHRRGIHAMGGMAAQIPIKGDAAANDAALAKVKTDKEREAKAGHDGTWVAHPGLIPIAKAQFDAHMPGDNQIDREGDAPPVTAADLLAVPTGTRSDEGLRHNVRVGILYLEAWLAGNGCVPLYNLMEDAATAEISRTQVWQWVRHGVDIGGSPVTAERLTSTIDEELVTIAAEVGEARFSGGKFPLARTLFEQICTAEQLPDFLTLVAYDHITTL